MAGQQAGRGFLARAARLPSAALSSSTHLSHKLRSGEEAAPKGSLIKGWPGCGQEEIQYTRCTRENVPRRGTNSQGWVLAALAKSCPRAYMAEAHSGSCLIERMQIWEVGTVGFDKEYYSRTSVVVHMRRRVHLGPSV